MYNVTCRTLFNIGRHFKILNNSEKIVYTYLLPFQIFLDDIVPILKILFFLQVTVSIFIISNSC